MQRILDGLEPQNVFALFEEISAIPRQSRNEKAVSAFILSFAQARGFEAVRDAAWNVVVNVPATPGHEDRDKVIMQCHTDMVCEKEDGLAFDFARDSLQLYTENGYIRARGTTLGADNGIGVALALAVMDAKKLPHPPLQFVFTAAEEVLFEGARALDAALLDGRYLIGLDCARNDILMVSAAGISFHRFSIPAVRVPLPDTPAVCAYTLSVGGLRGGHSAYAIHLGRANAIKLLGEVYDGLAARLPLRLLFTHGGTVLNAIPAWAQAVVCCDAGDAARFEHELSRLSDSICKAYRAAEPDMAITWSEKPLSGGETVLSGESADCLCTLLALLPNGAHSMMDTSPAFAECSSNLGTLAEVDGSLVLAASIRSNVEYRHDVLARAFARLAGLAGAEYGPQRRERAWEYDPDPRLQAVIAAVYREQNGQEPERFLSHASVECGVFIEKMAGRGLALDAVNIGCEIPDVHTTNERLLISSVGKTYRLLAETLARLAQYQVAKEG